MGLKDSHNVNIGDIVDFYTSGGNVLTGTVVGYVPYNGYPSTDYMGTDKDIPDSRRHLVHWTNSDSVMVSVVSVIKYKNKLPHYYNSIQIKRIIKEQHKQ